MHILPKYPHKRQQAPPALPTADGIADVGSTALAAATDTALVFDTSVAGSSTPAVTAPPLVANGPGTLTITSHTSSSTTALDSSPSTTPIGPASRSSETPMSSVIGACVGAFVGLVLLILLVVKCGKRKAVSAPSQNARSEHARRRSRLEPWKKLGDEEDNWEGKQQTREVHDEKFSMFKKSPSLHTRSSENGGSSEGHPYELPQIPFAAYHPGLAEELAQGPGPVRSFMGRVEGSPPVSWDGETVADDFLSLKSMRISSSGAMSPIRDFAIPTPPATVSYHKWESAEVVHPEVYESSNPFEDAPTEGRKSLNNPFFNAQDMGRKKSLRTINPFSDENVIPPQVPVSAANTDSMVSGMSSMTVGSDHAMQSLLAALNLPREEQERLRASVGASTIKSAVSMYDAEDIRSVGAFPLPPSLPRP